MTMAGYKVTMFMRQDRFGASESHYTQLTTQSAAANAALVLVKKRITLMPSDVSMFSVRVANTAPPFDVALVDPAGWAKAPHWIPGGTDDPMADQGKATAFVSIPMPGKRPAHTYLFGVPDALLGDDEKAVVERAPPSWLANWNVYAAELQASWGTRTVSPAAGNLGPFAVQTFSNLALTGAFQVSVLGAPALLVIGAKVFLRGFIRTNVAYTSHNGLYTITNVQTAQPQAGQTLYTLGRHAIPDAAQVVAPGTIEVRDFVNTPYGGLPILLRATTHKRGGRFLTGLGRRRTVKAI
jgi:hypothetical protein